MPTLKSELTSPRYVSNKIRPARVRFQQNSVLTVKTEEAFIIEGAGYGLHISRQNPTMELRLNGRLVATLNIASGVDTLDATDLETHLGPPSYYREAEGVVVIWQGSSTRWASKQVELRAWDEGFSYSYKLEGEGEIDRAHFFRTSEEASVTQAVRLFNPELQICYALEGEGNWLGLGVAAQPGEWNFSEMEEYPGAGFGFSLPYAGRVQVNGAWESPRLLCTVAETEYEAIRYYCDTLRELELVPQHGRGPQEEWWHEPIFGGEGEQTQSDLGETPLHSTQANYEDWLHTLEEHDLHPGTLVLDNKWQHAYGLNEADQERWPNLPGFIAAQHAKGRRVLLSLKAWDSEGVPPEECILDTKGQLLAVDSGNPAFRQRLTEQVRRMLQEWGADGFKIDFTQLPPHGKGIVSAGGPWGLELVRQWLEIVSDAAKAVKPDALIMAHAANPCLADLVDMLSLSDATEFRAIEAEASIGPKMSHRARIAQAASPYWLLEAGNWPCSSREQWRGYIQAQAGGEYGVPSLYNVGRSGRGATGETLEESDYETVKNTWETYRARLAVKANLNLRQKVGQLIMVEIPGSKLTDEIAEFILDCHPAGIALFGRNLAEPWTAAQLIADLQAVVAEAGEAPLLIGMDQEGGQVSHLRYPCAEMPSQMARAAAGGAVAAGEAAEVLGREMVRLGINLAFAPVLDVNTNPANPVIGTRAFSDDPQTVAECGVAAIEGLRRAGILSMAKHFPGHGDTALDSHLDLPALNHDWERMREIELLPFRAAIEAGVDTICSAHIIYPNLDDSALPATLSPKLMTDLLRNELGFKGVLFSDALAMDAIRKGKSSNVPPAAIAAIQAGVDCVMLLGKLDEQRLSYEALLAAVQDGTISESRLDEAVTRVQALRRRTTPPDPLVVWPDMAHQRAAQQMAQAAVTLVRDEAQLLPLSGKGLGVIEFASGSISPVETMRNEPLGASTLAFLLGRYYPETRFLALPSDVPNAKQALEDFLGGCEKVVVATRSAILDPAQATLLQQVAASGKPIIQLALRSPYDATLAPEIGTVLLTYGDQPTGVAAAVEVLVGNTKAQGRLPIKLNRPDLRA